MLDYYLKIVNELQNLTDNDIGQTVSQYNDWTNNDKLSITFMAIKDKKLRDKFRTDWAKKRVQECSLNEINKFDIIPTLNDSYISSLPKYSFAIQFNFQLATSYISKDDNDFYIIENPVKKDKVFNVPMVSPSTWKGQLRWTIRKIPSDPSQIIRLFGNERETEDYKRGRLVFYPTFFDKIGVEVINPHDRKTKAGKNPIYIEVVPPNAKGTFTLLYVPFGKVGSDKNTILGDMNVVVDGVKEMMLTYGFSAKKANGCGLIQRVTIEGHVYFNELVQEETKETSEWKKGNRGKSNTSPIRSLKDLKMGLGKKKEIFIRDFKKFKDVKVMLKELRGINE